MEIYNDQPLLAFTANSAAQSSAQTHIHSAIVVIDTSNNAWHSQVHWLVETPYLAVKASNDVGLIASVEQGSKGNFLRIKFFSSNQGTDQRHSRIEVLPIAHKLAHVRVKGVQCKNCH